MNPMYATLNTYDEIYDDNNMVELLDETTDPSFNPDINNFHLFEAELNSKIQIPETISNGFARLLMIYDPINELFYFDLKLNNLHNILSGGIYYINDNDEIDDKEILLLFKGSDKQRIKKSFSIHDTKLHVRQFLKYLKDGNIIVMINTQKYPEGEIGGFLNLIY